MTYFLTETGAVRVSKGSSVMAVLGLIDELNSFVGWCKVSAVHFPQDVIDGLSVSELLHEVQEDLFVIQAQIGSGKKTLDKNQRQNIEDIINEIEATLPPITHFTIPGGTELACILEILRTKARTAERIAVAVSERGGFSIDEEVLSYLNRLSSLFFALARFVNKKMNVDEDIPRY